MTEGIVIERKTRGEDIPSGVKTQNGANTPNDQGKAGSTQPGSEPQTAPGEL
jgi:hypothetical protein